MPRFFLALAALLLTACTTIAPVSEGLPGRAALRDFSVEARFSMRLERFGEPVQQGSGRLSWRHQNAQDRLFLASPLGTGLAEIEIGAPLARLRTAGGEVREHADADVLMQQVTGYALPVSHLAAWLLGRAGPQGELGMDALGRPERLREAGWQIDYTYAEATPAALPMRLTIQRPGEVSLLLRIDEWQALP